jgi:2-succinyl-5-enolpyruvyl-6-hydroxy-3-cyclohexene-1-carboxylate synthase
MMHAVLASLAELVASAGITDVVICPGSRSAPLVLAFVRQRKFKTHVFSDERSAAFIALGIAQGSGRPVVLICTSGSAAYNFAPAVAEAFFQQIPLIVLTADRPAEWIDQLDGQTTRQENLFGRHVKRAWVLSADYEHPDAQWHAQRVINESIYTASQEGPGPVHINFHFREPLYPTHSESTTAVPNRSIRVAAPRVTSDAMELAELKKYLAGCSRILVVSGQGNYSETTRASIQRFVHRYPACLVGDVLSNLHMLPETVRLADGFLGALSSDRKKELAPDLLITFGLSVISKNLKLFLRGNRPAQHWHVQPTGAVADTYQSLTRIIRSDVDTLFESLVSETMAHSPNSYADEWRVLEASTDAATRSYFSEPAPAEFFVVNEFIHALPQKAVLHLANSMPVRYANYVGLAHRPLTHVYANRGTSGIDGCTSTTVGHALCSDTLHVLLTGDIAFFYDSNAFWHSEKITNLRIVLLNNHGGVIFSLIDGPGDLPELGQYFVTHQKRTARALCTEFGIRHFAYTSADQWSEFFNGDGPALMEIESTPEQNKKYFNEFKQHLKSAL